MSPRAIAFGLAASLAALAVGAAWFMDSLPRGKREKQPTKRPEPEESDHATPEPDLAPLR